MQNEIRYIDLFGGVGGFSLALERANKNPIHKKRDMPDTNGFRQWRGGNKQNSPFNRVGYYELDKYAVQTYNKNFGTDYKPTDIREVREFPDHDLICAGFPCQAFSVAGKRRGFDDTRGTLFFEIARIAKQKQPRLLLLENVKGLLSHEKGQAFATILSTLDELGYDCQWQVLNSKNFGVPQNRERVFIVGHLRGESRPKVFPITGCSQEANGEHGNKTFTVSSSGRGYIEKGRVDKRMQYTDTAQTLTAMQDSVRSGTYVNENTRIRRLTPIECERLQAFPDNWTEGVSDTQRYKQMGNAVTVNVVEEIVRRLR